MARLYPQLQGSQSLAKLASRLRWQEADEASKAPRLLHQIASEASWQWCLERDDGSLVASAAIIPDSDGRGWFAGYPGAGLKSGLELRPLIKLYRILDQAQVFDELRAWVASEDRRAIHFAKAFGFVYDCGPATGFSPTGRDMDLMLWRR